MVYCYAVKKLLETIYVSCHNDSLNAELNHYDASYDRNTIECMLFLLEMYK